MADLNPALADVPDDQLEAMLSGVAIPEPVPVETEAPAPAAPEAEEAAPIEEAPEPEPEDVDWQARFEAAEAERARLEKIAGKNGGRADYWERVAKSRQDVSASPPPDVADDDEPSSYAGHLDLETQERIAALDQDRRARIAQDALKREIDNADRFIQGVDQNDRLAAATKFGDDYRDLKERADNGADPEYIGREAAALASAIVREANDLALQRQHAYRDQRPVTQFSRQEMKMRASVSGGGSTSTPPPAPKSLADMSNQEIDRLMKELTRG